jgi:hypothetical protein
MAVKYTSNPIEIVAGTPPAQDSYTLKLKEGDIRNLLTYLQFNNEGKDHLKIWNDAVSNLGQDDASAGLLKWSSNNTTVASISKTGKVEAVSKGETVIELNFEPRAYKLTVPLKLTVKVVDDSFFGPDGQLTPAIDSIEKYISDALGSVGGFIAGGLDYAGRQVASGSKVIADLLSGSSAPKLTDDDKKKIKDRAKDAEKDLFAKYLGLPSKDVLPTLSTGMKLTQAFIKAKNDITKGKLLTQVKSLKDYKNLNNTTKIAYAKILGTNPKTIETIVGLVDDLEEVENLIENPNAENIEEALLKKFGKQSIDQLDPSLQSIITGEAFENIGRLKVVGKFFKLKSLTNGTLQITNPKVEGNNAKLLYIDIKSPEIGMTKIVNAGIVGDLYDDNTGFITLNLVPGKDTTVEIDFDNPTPIGEIPLQVKFTYMPIDDKTKGILDIGETYEEELKYKALAPGSPESFDTGFGYTEGVNMALNAVGTYKEFKKKQFLSIFDKVDFKNLPGPVKALVTSVGSKFGVSASEITTYYEGLSTLKNFYDIAGNLNKFDQLPPELKSKFAQKLGIKEEYLTDIVTTTGKLTDVLSGKTDLSLMDVLDDTYKKFSEKFLNEFAPGVSSWRDFDKLDPKLQQMVATGLGFTPDEEGIKRVSNTIKNANRFEESVRSSIDLKNKILQQKKDFEDSKKSLLDLVDSPLYQELGGISDNAKDLYESADSLREDAYADYKNITDKTKQEADEAAGKDPEPIWTEKIGAPPIKEKEEPDDLAKEAEVPKSLTETKGSEAVAQLSTRELLIEVIKNNGMFVSTQEHKINPDGTVDWLGEVSITSAGLINGKLPVKFNLIKGNFRCDGLKLDSLQNAPKIVEGVFDCSNNNLKTLEGAPQECGGFNVSGNPLGDGTGLKFGPTKINGATDKKIFGGFVDQTTKIDVYNVSNCKLKTLKDSGLKEIGPGGVNCSSNDLTSFEGMEEPFSGTNIRSFNCSNNPKLTSMKGAPKISPDPATNTYGEYNFSNCDIKEIDSSLPERVGNFLLSGNSLTTLSFLPSIIDGDLDVTKSRGTKFSLQSLGKDRFAPVGKENSTLQRVVNVKGTVYTDNGVYDQHLFDINTVDTDAPKQNNTPKNSSGVEILDTGNYKITVMDPSMAQVGYKFGNRDLSKVTPQNAQFKKLTAPQWIDEGYQNFVNSAFFEANGRPSGNFFINGLNYGAKIEIVDILDTSGKPKLDSNGKPIPGPGLGQWWPVQTANPTTIIYDSKNPKISGKKAIDENRKSPIKIGFAGSHLLVINGEVRPNPTWEHGSDRRPRTAVGIRKDGKFVVFATESKLQFKQVGEELVKLDVVTGFNYDSGGSTMKVRDGKVIVKSEDPGDGRAVSVILYWGEVNKKS